MQECEGHSYGRVPRIGQHGPTRFVIGLNRRVALRERQFEAHICVHMTVGEMVDHLPYRPAIGTIWSIELLVSQAGDSFGQLFWDARDLIDCAAALLNRQFGFALTFPNWIAVI